MFRSYSTLLTIVLGLVQTESLSGFVLAVPAISRADSGGDIVDTGYAKYLGNRSFPNTVAYLGLPYAEPPLGERRFRAPLPLNTTRVQLETDGQVVDARQYPDFCIQGPIGGE